MKKKIFAVALLLFTIIIAGVVVWMLNSQSEPVTISVIEADPTANPPGFDSEIIDVGSEYQYSLQLVTADQITIAPRTEQMQATDIADYETRSDDIARVNPEFAKRDTAYEMTFAEGSTFADYLSQSEDAGTIYELYDEMLYLAGQFDSEAEVAPLYQVIPEAMLMGSFRTNPFPGNAEVVYPSQRATEGLLVAELMSRIDPLNRDQYLADGQAFAERGILYGQYGITSINSAQSLVDQYFNLIDESNPELLVSLTK